MDSPKQVADLVTSDSFYGWTVDTEPEVRARQRLITAPATKV